MTLSAVTSSPFQPNYSERDSARTNLGQSIQTIFNEKTTETPIEVSSPHYNMTFLPIIMGSFPQSASDPLISPESLGNLEEVNRDYAQSAPNITKPYQPMMTQIAIIQQVPVVTSGENLFNGLAKNVGQLNVTGVISEAFKLAQISIGLFGQALANQLTVDSNSLLVIHNSTKLVGEQVKF